MELNLENIEKVLNEKVRPTMIQHEGNLIVEGLEDGVLSVRFLGQCNNCPSAELTLENVVNEELMAEFPDLKRVTLISGVSDELINFAKEFLKKRHSQDN